MREKQDRSSFLIVMYEQMWHNINRHILVVWQSIAALIGAFTLLALTEKKIISLDVAIALISLLCAWVIAHVNDAQKWYSRNLTILTNIERQFLASEDACSITPYFAQEHRPAEDMIDHLRLQKYLAIGIWLTVLVYHIYERLVPCMKDLCGTTILIFVPCTLSIVLAWVLDRQRCNAIKAHEKFLANFGGADGQLGVSTTNNGISD